MDYNDSGAKLSKDRVYRYLLWRKWSDFPCAMFIGLNPSTADEFADDPTIRRCVGFAKQWGCGGIHMLNLFAFRATKPENMKKAADPIGPENAYFLKIHALVSEPIVACWGVHGTFRDRAVAIKIMLPGMQCFGLTKAGHPKHPLYLPKNTALTRLPK